MAGAIPRPIWAVVCRRRVLSQGYSSTTGLALQRSTSLPVITFLSWLILLGSWDSPEFEIQSRKYSKMLQLCYTEAIYSVELLEVTYDTCRLHFKQDWHNQFVVCRHCLTRSFWLHESEITQGIDFLHDKVYNTWCCKWKVKKNKQIKHMALTDGQMNISTGGFCGMPMCCWTMDVPWQQSGLMPMKA